MARAAGRPRALVVGGRRGIGSAVVDVLARRGADVSFTFRSAPETVDRHLTALRAAHPDAAFEALPLDLVDRADVERFADGLEAWEPFGTFVQVGGVNYDALAAVMDQDAAESAMQVNFWSFARIVRALVLSGSTLYAGGQFTTIGGQTRNRIAALETSTGNATSSRKVTASPSTPTCHTTSRTQPQTPPPFWRSSLPG